jgi:hypothetical protein
MKRDINESIERMNNKRLVLRTKLQQQESLQLDRLEKRKIEFMNRGKESVAILGDAIDAQLSGDRTAEKSRSHAIRRLKRKPSSIRFCSKSTQRRFQDGLAVSLNI